MWYNFTRTTICQIVSAKPNRKELTPMPQHLSPNDPRLSWHGAVSLQQTDQWTMPWRAPYADRILFPTPLLERAAMPAGVRLAFLSDTTHIAGTIDPQADNSRLDLCCDGNRVGSVELARRDSFQFDNLKSGEKLIELWLPQYGSFRLKSLQLSDGASVEPFEETRPRWITYGSSITQCRAAESPIYTWPAIVAREHGLNLTCLGYGGQCHLDPMVARMIRDLPADYISICAGINIQGASSLSPRTFRPAIIGSVQTIREKHPDIPLVLISPIYSPPRENHPNVVGFNLKLMREEVAAAVNVLRTHGDANIHYLNGLELFGAKYAHLLPDELHPNAEGYKVMGRNFLEKVAGEMFR
jgi:hypothetical protein